MDKKEAKPRAKKGTSITEYRQVETAIKILTKKYKVVPDVNTKDGLKFCKKQYREIRKYEIDLEGARKSLGIEARKHLDTINSEAKLIDTQVKLISAPFKTAFETRELELKQIEEKRIIDIKKRISDIKLMLSDAIGRNSEEISGIIEAVDLIDCGEFFEEFTQEALNTVTEVKNKLGEALHLQIQSEQNEIARKKLVIQKRVSALKMTPLEFMDKSSDKIKEKIDSLTSYTLSKDEFGDSYQEAVRSKDSVIKQLSTIHANALKLEAVVIPEEATSSDVQDDLKMENIPDDVVSAGISVIDNGQGVEVSNITAMDEMFLKISNWADRHNVSLLATEELEAIIKKHLI